jgi:hypothetical protein
MPYPYDPLDPYIGAYGGRRLTGRPRGSPAGMPYQAREASPFGLTRERIFDELENDPKLQQNLDRNTTAEVGTDPGKRRWYQALTMDRAVQTGKPLAEVVNAPDYYPPETTRATATTGQGTDESLYGPAAANPANYATGNASFDPKTGRWVGFAGGPQTSTYGTGRGMELGGIEGQAGLPYARAMGYGGPERTAIGPSGPRGDPETAVAGLSEQANQPATYPRREEGRKMPASLMDMFSGRAPLEFSPTDAAGGQTDFGGALASRSNSLIGLGLGLLQPSNPLRGQSTWGNALEGFQSGSALDTRQAQLKQQTARDAYQRQQHLADQARAQANTDRSFGEQVRQFNLTAEGGKVPPGWAKAPDGSLAPIPGGPADPKYLQQTTEAKAKPREMSITDISKLSEEGGKYAQVGGFTDSFEPRFAGYKSSTVGDIANLAGRNLPAGVVGKDVAEGATWWQGYDRYKNVIRNDLYGSALTPSEQAAFEKADITPGMDPDQIKKNLVTQKEVVQNGLKRKANAMIASGYDPKVIAQSYGVDLKELGVTATGRRDPGSPTDPAPPKVTAPAPDISTIDPRAIKALKANPQRRDEFDAKYGEGAAMRVLTGK